MASVSADKLDLLGMLWFHGSKSQKEAEHSLESQNYSGESCYILRECKGVHYLSCHYRGMYYHLPITRSKHGYILKDHYNAFPTLQELVSHHQKHAVYVDNGEFTLQTACHKDFFGLSMTYINDFTGSCTIQVWEDSISIKGSNGRKIGSWPYAFIREFRFDDERFQFSFKSGRRGPFGVADYLFKLHDRTFYGLRETVNRIAEGKSGSPSKPQDLKPPVPPHASSRGRSPTRNRDSTEITYDDLPTIRSVGHHRSASNPDLTRDFVLEKFTRKEGGGSTRVSPSHHSSSLTPPPKPVKKLSLQCSTSDYHVPKPAIESIYNTPRPMSDPRNDYQIPKPMDETYMVPRPANNQSKNAPNDSTAQKLVSTGKGMKNILEHSYI